MATRIAEATTDPRLAQRFSEQAQADRSYAEIIRKILFTDDKEARSADRRWFDQALPNHYVAQPPRLCCRAPQGYS